MKILSLSLVRVARPPHCRLAQNPVFLMSMASTKMSIVGIWTETEQVRAHWPAMRLHTVATMRYDFYLTFLVLT